MPIITEETPDTCVYEDVRPTLRKVLELCEAEGLSLLQLERLAKAFDQIVVNQVYANKRLIKFHIAERIYD